MVGAALGVLAQEPLELAAAEEAAVGAAEQQLGCRPRELAPEPGIEWDAEARLRTRVRPRRQIGREGPREGRLARGERRRQRQAELDDVVVEQRRAELERDGHRGDVALRQEVAREVGLDVDDAEVGVVRQQRLGRLGARLVGPEGAAELEREDLDEPRVASGRRLGGGVEEASGAEERSSAAFAGPAGTPRGRQRRAQRPAGESGRRARGPGTARSRRTPRRRRRRRARL